MQPLFHIGTVRLWDGRSVVELDWGREDLFPSNVKQPSGGKKMEPFIGMIVGFGGNFAPRGWALCDGQLLPISSYSALFSILGTTYGGDGRTTFGLPDLRGRSAVHAGSGPGLPDVRLGEKGGSTEFTLSAAQMPAHNHSFHAETAAADQLNPQGRMLALPAQGNEIYAAVVSTEDREMATQSIGSAGGGQSVVKRSPYQAINFIIALQGVFPSRD